MGSRNVCFWGNSGHHPDVGDGELARICKIAHNVMLGVVIENLIEITLLANKMGVPRHAFLAFMNNGVMGSMFTAYKTSALVNLDWTTTFTPELLRKDLDLGLDLGREYDVPMPVTAATREVVQQHIGKALSQPNAKEILAEDFAKMAETMAELAGMKLTSENKDVGSGLYQLPPLIRIVVAIDPNASSAEDANECGIVCAGLGENGHAYVLDDISGVFAPNDWASRAIGLHRERRGDRIIAEINNGGEMVENTLRMVDPSVPYSAVWASRGKVTRAEGDQLGQLSEVLGDYTIAA
jgi:hypothetical protein